MRSPSNGEIHWMKDIGDLVKKGEVKRPGFGLGLTICKKIIESHGGELQIKSKIGEGSVFSLILPLN